MFKKRTFKKFCNEFVSTSGKIIIKEWNKMRYYLTMEHTGLAIGFVDLKTGKFTQKSRWGHDIKRQMIDGGLINDKYV